MQKQFLGNFSLFYAFMKDTFNYKVLFSAWIELGDWDYFWVESRKILCMFVMFATYIEKWYLE